VLSSLLLMAGGTAATYSVRYLAGRIPLTMPQPSTVGAAGVALAPVVGSEGLAAAPTAPSKLDFSRPKVLVATRGAPRLLDFAANYCQKTQAIMFVLFVRQVNVTMTGTVAAPRAQDDADAMAAFKSAAEICKRHGVGILPIYAVSSDVPYTILDFAATYSVEAVMMGVSRQAALIRALRGDVISAVADNLPEDISLLIHA
jgi:hypothetical protein